MHLEHYLNSLVAVLHTNKSSAASNSKKVVRPCARR